jgi:hypothetical protein
LNMKFYRYIFCIIMVLISCVDPYNPPATQNGDKFLVVDGFINAGGGTTTFTLTYTSNLGDTAKISYPNGKVYVESEGGQTFELIGKGKGVFESQLNLSSSDKYRLHIKLNDGRDFLSDFVEVKASPEIDEISWQGSSDGVIIYLSTHDDSKSSRYYQWKYDETWEFNSAFYSSLKYENKEFVARDQSEQIYTCYQSDYSKSILVGSSEKLAQDILYKFPIISVGAIGTSKLSRRYSIKIQQSVISKEAFEYWTELKKITESLGSLYDPQPSAVFGNIKNVQDPSEPVIGFISAGITAEKRIFITRAEYGYSYKVTTGYEGCVMDTIPGHGTPPKTFEGGMIPLHQEMDMQGTMQLYVGSTSCVDCSLRGTTQKPDFW